MIGFYAASKSAFVTLSEGLRLELKSLGVRAVTVIVGAVPTNIFDTTPAHIPPANSRYKPVEKRVEARVTGHDVESRKDSAEDFAHALVGEVLASARGRR